MGRKVTFDLDEMIAAAQRLAPRLPSLMGAIASQVPGAGPLVRYAEMAPAFIEALSDVAGKGDRIALPPVDGESGKARGRYLRSGKQWTDQDVIDALAIVLETAGESGAPVRSTLAHTERALFGRQAQDASEARRALDLCLQDDDAMPETVADQIAAHVVFVLQEHSKKE